MIFLTSFLTASSGCLSPLNTGYVPTQYVDALYLDCSLPPYLKSFEYHQCCNQYLFHMDMNHMYSFQTHK